MDDFFHQGCGHFIKLNFEFSEHIFIIRRHYRVDGVAKLIGHGNAVGGKKPCHGVDDHLFYVQNPGNTASMLCGGSTETDKGVCPCVKSAGH